MRLPRAVLVFALAIPVAAQTRYVAYDEAAGNWCVFLNKRLWQEAVQRSRGARLAGLVEYRNKKPYSLEIFVEAESGDWSVEDRYRMDSNGAVRTLTRTIRFAGTSKPHERTDYVAAAGGLKLTRRARAGHDGKPFTGEVDWLPELPKRKHLREFPFAVLLDAIEPNCRALPEE